jgi:hypothetical protein
MQELWNTIKRANLRNMDIEEREEYKLKTFNKMTA